MIEVFQKLQYLLQSLDYVISNKYQLFLLTLQVHLSVCLESVPQIDLSILSDRITDSCVPPLLGVSAANRLPSFSILALHLSCVGVSTVVAIV